MRFTRAMFAKAGPETSTEAARLERLLVKTEGAVRAAFERFIADATDEALMADVADLLERGDIAGALALIETHIQAMGTVMPRLFQDAATAEVTALAGQLNARIGISFDPGMPEAAALMRANQLEFVSEMTDQQRAATRETLAQGLDVGRGIRPTVTAFKDSIGLSRAQVEAVANYRRLLEANSAQALDRVLRDRRFDPSIEAAIEEGEPLSPEKIDRMVDRYRARQLDFRAETIARTESIKVLSEAQETAFSQVMAKAGVRPDDVEQSWHATLDDRTRDTHRIMNGQTKPFGVPFISPSGAVLRYPGDPLAPAEEVCNCRCRRSFRIILSGMERRAA